MILKLTNKGYSISLDTRGGELKSYMDETGKEFIWNSNPEFWSRSSPLLFPTIGNVRNGKTIINGKEYEIPKHGFLRDMQMEYEATADDTISLFCSANEDTLAHYPFHFQFRQTYQLDGPVLHMTYLVKNIDDTEMYYHFGGHPGFMCPLEKEETFSDYILKFPFVETCDSPVYDLENMQFDKTLTKCYLNHSDTIKLDYSLFDIDALVFPHMKSRSVQLINPSSGKGVQVDYPDFTTIAFWTPAKANAPFLCIEPWNGAAIFADEDNDFTHKRDIQLLKAGESKTYKLTIRLLT